MSGDREERQRDRAERKREREERRSGRGGSCPGCRDGERAPAGPALLADDLVIAARQRAREPELPAETVERALAASMPEAAAKYDLVFLPPDDAARAAAGPLAVEFAKHGHRVFWLEDPAAPYAGPRPPLLHVVALPELRPAAIQAALVRLRDGERAETAAIVVPDPRWLPATERALAAWNWRRAELLGETLRTPSGDAIALDGLPGWPARWAAADAALRQSWPRASVIVITFDNLAYNKMCLASLLENTDYPNLELLVVDNGSTDGTVEWLNGLAARFPQVRPILNPDNRGFGPANNQAMAAATGDILVLLNNDTIVPPGWLTRLARGLANPRIGLLGPATNRTCNEAQVDVEYATYGEYLELARRRGRDHAGEIVPIRMLAMFCTAFRRDVYERLGPLDERYEVGMFEDEDYAVRVKDAGWAVAWMPEVYIHHAYHASIGKLLTTGGYVPLFRTNQVQFERKWGICWESHRPRPTA